MAAHDIFVIAEHLDGTLSDVTFELLGKARGLAPALGGQVQAVVLGSGVRALADQLGAADQVLLIEDAVLEHFNPERTGQVLQSLLAREQPALTLVANTTMGMDLAAGLSAALDWPLIAYCSDVQIRDGHVVATSQIYGGKIAVEAASTGEHTIVSVLAGAAPAADGRASAPATIRDAASELAAGTGSGRIRFKGLTIPEAGDVDITREPVLVSVGRGIGAQDNIELVEELARALGAAVSASRPIVDSGWLPKQRQVGKSGLTVKPKLYLALGISGAPEHLQGMKDAELIIAVNSDPSAPIFEVAHYGIVGDLFDIVPALTEQLAAVRSQ